MDTIQPVQQGSHPLALTLLQVLRGEPIATEDRVHELAAIQVSSRPKRRSQSISQDNEGRSDRIPQTLVVQQIADSLSEGLIEVSLLREPFLESFFEKGEIAACNLIEITAGSLTLAAFKVILHESDVSHDVATLPDISREGLQQAFARVFEDVPVL